MRIALLCTPRSGNTWLRLMLASILKLEQFAVHDLGDIEWNVLPSRALVALHWYRTIELTGLLETHGFRVVTMARHPLDTLLSILQFSPKEPQTARWLNGLGGNELSIHGELPTSKKFLAYCSSERASALLGVTPEWWNLPNVAQLRYEDLVKDRDAALSNLLEQLGCSGHTLGDSLDEFNISKLRQTTKNGHFWQGCPGLWQKLFTTDDANNLVNAQKKIFKSLGYSCDLVEAPDVMISAASIDTAWKNLTSCNN